MEVVPTNDGDEDDGVIWFRCPQCQGFLPKLSGADLGGGDSADDDAGHEDKPAEKAIPESAADDDGMEWDSPADMMAAQKEAGTEKSVVSPFLPEDEVPTTNSDPAPVADKNSRSKKSTEPEKPAEPIHEYAAMLAAQDVTTSTPYRPWGNYEVGDCVHHLAWDDCGVVVAKEDLPGGRKVVKCYFGEAGVVRLIEQAPK